VYYIFTNVLPNGQLLIDLLVKHYFLTEWRGGPSNNYFEGHHLSFVKAVI